MPNLPREHSSAKTRFLIAVTSPLSCNFYNGVLGHLRRAGFESTLLSAPGDKLRSSAHSLVPVTFLFRAMQSKPKLFFAVTVSISCVFYRGMLRYLEAAGFSTTMVSAPGTQLNEVSSSQGATSVAVPMEREIRPLHDLVSLWRLYRTMRAARPEVVDASTPKAGLLGSLAAMLARVPCRVYTLRGLRMETATGLKRLVLWLAERLACACAHRVVPVSKSLRLRAIELKLVSPEKARSLGNGSCGVDTEHFTPKNRNSEQVAQLRQALGLTGNETVIGFAGRFVKDKGIRELVEAFRELSASRPDLRLLLVGDFENGDAVEPEVRSYIESTPTILLPGFVADIAPYYALMNVFVLPTYREGFPSVPLEAQASEVPVVTTNATGALDSVRHGITGLIVPVKDAKALTAAIDTLLRKPEMRTNMGHAGRKWVEHAFRPEVVWQAHVEMYREMLEEHSQRERQPRASLAAKRVFDVFLATAALIVLSPLLVAIAVVVRIFLGAPALFRQVRPGYKARSFTCLKFRTMTDKRDAEGQLLSDAERLTPLGQFLRSTSLDELPELINVIRGEMSLVGPRPLLMEYLAHYTPEQARRHDVRPGITGWAQVNGRQDIPFSKRFKLDVWYVDHQDLKLDLKILLATVVHAVRGTGVRSGQNVSEVDDLGLSSGLRVKQ
jgi:lipopolysaccharide/colanic/teichoic acid biosynthesis glycosyltransferase